VRGLDHDRASAIGRLDGVVHKIDDDAAQLLRVDADLRQPIPR
jgi:hypothetical protein